VKTLAFRLVRSPAVLDWGPAVAAGAFTAVAALAGPYPGNTWVGLVLLCVYVAGIGTRRRWPLVAHAMVVAAVICEILTIDKGEQGTFVAFSRSC
jgi:hypothetical protein